ncbi:unnamed protein product [Phytomonas sp. EM1]|nr:unnamed protein product [Phytomonas sp. EM1]|eukprot:CCW59658.1 unnamed protein product [Phytomonas sp. isolate EM1]
MGYIINELYRFRMLVGGVYLGILISSSYGFSIFTEHLKSKYGFTQSEISTISTVGNCTGYLSFFAGMLFDFMGPKVVIFISGCLGSLGFMLYGLAFDDIIPNNHNRQSMLVQFCVFNTILYLGCPSLDVCALMSLMLNFPLERGYMVIIQKTFSGLGTAVIVAYFNAWFNKSGGAMYSSYAYFLASQFVIYSIVGILTIDLPPYFMCDYTKKRASAEERAEREETRKYFMTQHASKRRLLIGCTLTILMLIFAIITSIVLGSGNVSGGVRFALGIIALILVLLFMVMAFPFQFFGRYTPIRKSHPKFSVLGFPEGDDLQVTETVLGPAPEEINNNREPDHDCYPDQSAEGVRDISLKNEGQTYREVGSLEHLQETSSEKSEQEMQSAPLGDPQIHGSFWSHLLTLDLWLLWITFFGVWGTATVMIMNAAQLYRSINMGKITNTQLTLYITIISLGSAIGRLSSGVIDMWLLNKSQKGRATMSITALLPVSALLLTVGYLLFAIVGAHILIIPFFLVSLGNGLGWGLGGLTIRAIYAEDLGKHYNFMFLSGFVCTITLNRFMFGEMYDRRAERYGTLPDCNHPDCVRPQMWILMAADFVSLLSSLILYFRYKRFVMRELLKRKESA